MPIDLLFLIALGLGFWHGYSKGIIGTVFNVLALLFGVVLAFKIAPTTTEILKRMFNSDNPSFFIAAFLLNMGLIVFMLRATANALEKGMQAVYLGFINRVLGGSLMGGLSLLIYSVLLWFVIQVKLISDDTLDKSKTYPLLKEMPGSAKQVAVRLLPFAEEMWSTSMNWIGEVDNFGGPKTEEPPKVIETPEGDTGIEENPDGQPARPLQLPAANEDGIEE
jgi:membrane protein required for colicin V production